MMKEVLKLENITKNFDTADGKLEILKDINLSVYSSQSVSIVVEVVLARVHYYLLRLLSINQVVEVYIINLEIVYLLRIVS